MESTMTALLRDASRKKHHGILLDRLDFIAHTRSLISVVINTYCGQALTRIVISSYIPLHT